MALVLLILGPLAIVRTPTDIFPDIDIPVVAVVWNYSGLSAEEMATRIVYNFERVAHDDGQRHRAHRVAVAERHRRHQGLLPAGREDRDGGRAGHRHRRRRMLRQLPPGTTPPLIIRYNASSVPILQLALSGETLSEQQLYDLGVNFIRTQLATVQGAAIPLPVRRQAAADQVDLDPDGAAGEGPLAGRRRQRDQRAEPDPARRHVEDRHARVRRRHQREPADGRRAERPADQDRQRRADLHPRRRARARRLPAADQHRRASTASASALLTILKTGNASTLDIVDAIKATLPRSLAGAAAGAEGHAAGRPVAVRPRRDRRRGARGGASPPCLTALMILLFLGSWRSTLIVAISIPLSILASIIALSALGETINIMTLGGLALAVGILVDDATVEIENIHRNLEQGKPLEPAILDGAQQIAVPAFVSTLCICIVFVPMFFLTGVARYLFVPLGRGGRLRDAGVLPAVAHAGADDGEVPAARRTSTTRRARAASRNPLARLQRAFERGFERAARRLPRGCSSACVARRAAVRGGVPRRLRGVARCSCRWVGQDFFPAVDSGQFQLHVRAPTGTRIEETARALRSGRGSRSASAIPARDLGTIIDNIGLPYSGINLTYSNSAPIGAGRRRHPGRARGATTADRRLRPRAARRAARRASRACTFSFLPADIVSQILNFGLPAPIDVQIVGQQPRRPTAQFAGELLARAARRSRARRPARAAGGRTSRSCTSTSTARAPPQLGLTQRDVANNLLVSLSGSGQTTPTFWLNPTTGVSYSIATQTPQYRIDSLQALRQHPDHRRRRRHAADARQPRVGRRAVAASPSCRTTTCSRSSTSTASVQGRDLGGVVARHRTASSTRAEHDAAARHRSIDGPRPGRDDDARRSRAARRAWRSRSCSSTC